MKRGPHSQRMSSGSPDKILLGGRTMDLRPGKKSTGGGPFEKLGLCKEVCEAAKTLGFNLPSPIQRKAIPIILSETGDVLANARTGSGKTAAFLFPIIHRLRSHVSVVGARCLIVLPTRELALQTGLVIRKIIKACGRGAEAATLRICYLIGGMSMAKQFEHLSNNPDVIVCTPGRLVHQMIEADFRLTRVNTLVFDEGDMLFEMGFEDDVNTILKAVASCVKKQIIITSATLPTQLVQFSRAKLQNPQFVQLDLEQTLPDTLALHLYFIRATDKTAALLFWLENAMPADSQCIIFCGTSHHVAYLAEVLRFYSRSSASELHHRSSGCKFKGGPFSCTQLAGQLSQGSRDEAMKDFVKKNTRILLATDVAARGVDIDQLDYVIHYTFPASPKLFVHRSGRTARKGQDGACVSFITREEFPYLVDLLLFVGRKIRLPNAQSQAEEVAQEVEKFAFDFGLGDDLDKIVSCKQRAAGEVAIGGLPDLNEYRETVALANSTDSSVAKLVMAMRNGEKAYLRHRQPASKQSLKRTAKILEQLGGPGALADSLHPTLASIAQSETIARKIISQAQEPCHLFTDLKGEVKSEVKSPLDQTDVELLDLEGLRSFRPSASKQSVKRAGVSAKVLGDVEARRANLRAVAVAVSDSMTKKQELSSGAVSDSSESSEDALREVRSKRRLSRAARRNPSLSQKENKSKRYQQLQNMTPFDLAPESRDEAQMVKEMGLVLDSSRKIEQNTFGILGEENSLRKPKQRMRWNASKKKYEMVDVDRASGKRVVKNDAGKLVVSAKKGLYKRWAASTQRRIQNVGEVEDAQLASAFLSQRQQRREARFGTAEGKTSAETVIAPLSELTGNKGLLEKLERKLPLTAKEQRIHKRLLKMQSKPIVTGTAQNSKSEKKVKVPTKPTRSTSKKGTKSDVKGTKGMRRKVSRFKPVSKRGKG